MNVRYLSNFPQQPVLSIAALSEQELDEVARNMPSEHGEAAKAAIQAAAQDPSDPQGQATLLYRLLAAFTQQLISD
jgi:hypothetical protein